MKDTTVKLFKIVFTSTSGKSIVYTMTEENVEKIFNEWKEYKEKEYNDIKVFKIIEICKVKDGLILERLGIDIKKIDAIQIDSAFNPAKV
jgi:hypothetical protein